MAVVKLSHLEVGELRVLLLQDVGHVVDQVQTKSILGGDFLLRDKFVLTGCISMTVFGKIKAIFLTLRTRHFAIHLHFNVEKNISPPPPSNQKASLSLVLYHF